MGRYRPPVARSAPYITPEGARALREELHQLWKVERPVVTAAVHEAAKNGDRSENGDYIYGKKRLREIDRRVRYLSKRLDELTIVDRQPENRDKIYFGAWVTLEDAQENQHRFRLVGADEIDPAQHKISIDSPLGRQLLGKCLNDEISLAIKGTAALWLISEICYTPRAGNREKPAVD
ncbi:transcription elongation factor GreB [uncultured Porticoccus sp.]|uniref:transcription elongation factor GreB n=1 Tax=uncultured Porticoccus sp. TaxID=1256050 RepID=UPI00261B3BAC|nr:transcription elongation factor GreB [uncultured Porticoccus sp.]